MKHSVVEIPLEKLNNVNWKDPIGMGSFGKVFRGTWLGTDVAVKQVRRGAAVKQSVEREAVIHSKLHHPNIVTLLGISVKKKDILLVTEFVEGNSVQDLIDEETLLIESFKVGLIRDILKGVAYLHEVGVVHGDIKPGNILVSSKLNVAKLCDFGLGKLRQHASLSVASVTQGERILEGTPSYMAPECIIHKAGATRPSDIWSLAITILELLTLEDAWEMVFEGIEGESDLTKLISVYKASLLPGSLGKLSSTHQSNIKLCLNYNNKERPSALELLQMQW